MSAGGIPQMYIHKYPFLQWKWMHSLLSLCFKGIHLFQDIVFISFTLHHLERPPVFITLVSKVRRKYYIPHLHEFSETSHPPHLLPQACLMTLLHFSWYIWNTSLNIMIFLAMLIEVCKHVYFFEVLFYNSCDLKVCFFFHLLPYSAHGI